MYGKVFALVIGISVAAASAASGQVVRGMMTVTGAEMH
jgi:hypothetical protein